MLRTTKSMKEKYEKIQTYIFSLIPEKWEGIYLYASVFSNYALSITNEDEIRTGELFFYYLPKGILKKRAINVYEVPKRFNINEEQYLVIVEELYKCIKSLQQDFIDTEQDVWTNLTLTIVNSRFKIEYNYEELPKTEKEINERNVIWKYKYLQIGGNSREEKRILDKYFSVEESPRKEVYETGLYIKTDNNNIDFDKESFESKEVVVYEKDNILDKTANGKNKIFINRKESIENDLLEESNIQDETSKKKLKNQILDN